MRRQSRSRLALGVGNVLILSFLLSMHLVPDRVSLHVGEASPVDIRAHRTVRYFDRIRTERLKEEAAARVVKVYRPIRGTDSDPNEVIQRAFSVLRQARSNSNRYSLKNRIRLVKRNLRLELSDQSLAILLRTDDRTFKQVEAYSVQLIREIMGQEIRDDTDDAQRARAEFRRRITNFLGNGEVANAAADLGGHVIRPNRIFDQAATERAREVERDSVKRQYGQIYLGDLIISKGERVTQEHIDKFTALGLRHPKLDYFTAVCIGLLVTCTVILVTLYIARYHSAIYHSTKLLILLSLIVVLSVLGLKLGSTMLGLQLSGVQFGYFSMIWIATAGMLTAILLSPQLAVLIVALLSTTSGLAMQHELRWALAAVVSSLIGIYVVSDIRHRSDLMRAAVVMCAANLAMVGLVGRICGDSRADLMVGSTWAIAGGLGSIMFFWLGTAMLEKPFGITTHIRLLELTDTNSPVLRRLLMEAPGTYSHSIFVGNLAAAAAEEIGADALLVRAASYYHDVGKMKRPHFFVENQHVENAHDRLNPSISALIIRSHIKDGLELAREYRLGPLISELMSQHHGTSLIRYFYQQATGVSENDKSGLEQHFRYEGIRPQSKEAALLMLADAVEAASRALSRPTPGSIESMVHNIVDEKFRDGQLDESELTFKDISRIKESFVRTLTSMLHARIEYPETTPAEVKKSVGNGSSGKESATGESEPGQAEKSRSKVTSV